MVSSMSSWNGVYWMPADLHLLFLQEHNIPRFGMAILFIYEG